MALTSVILIVDRYFEDQEIIVDNLKNANSSVELLILNNFGFVIQELKDLSTHYIESNSIIEMNFAECVNVILPYCSGDYILILHDYGYLNFDWLKNLITSYKSIENSGVVSILSNTQEDQFLYDKELCFFLNVKEDMDCRYFDKNLVSGLMFFSKELLGQLGALNTKLNQKYVFWEYCFRAGLLGKYNYYLLNEYCIKIVEYTSAYCTTLKEYKNQINQIEIFKILNPDVDYSLIIQKLKQNNIDAEYTKKINCVIAIKNEFQQDQLAVINEICKELNYSYKIICTGYYDNYIWKGRVALLINKLL